MSNNNTSRKHDFISCTSNTCVSRDDSESSSTQETTYDVWWDATFMADIPLSCVEGDSIRLNSCQIPPHNYAFIIPKNVLFKFELPVTKYTRGYCKNLPHGVFLARSHDKCFSTGNCNYSCRRLDCFGWIDSDLCGSLFTRFNYANERLCINISGGFTPLY